MLCIFWSKYYALKTEQITGTMYDKKGNPKVN